MTATPPSPRTLMVADITCQCGTGFLAQGDAAVSLAAMPYYRFMSMPHRARRRLPSNEDRMAYLAVAAPHAAAAGWRRDQAGQWWCPTDAPQAPRGDT